MLWRQKMKKIIIGLACALMLIASPTLAKSKKKKKNSGRVTVESFKKRTVTDLGTEEVNGRVAKPSVFFIVSRASVSGLMAPRYQFRGYIGKILNEALKRPF